MNMKLLWHYVEKWATEKPDAEALVYDDRRITWREFNDLVNQAAKAFLSYGIERGDRIGMVAMGCPEFMISFMAASKIGAIWLGLSPKFTPDELRYILGHSEPTLLLTLRSYLDVDLVEAGLTFKQEYPTLEEVLVIGEPHEMLPDFNEVISRDWSHLDAALEERVAQVDPEDEVLLMYTSGSTGRPKGVLQTQRAIVENIEVEAKYFYLHPNSRVLLHFPINHVAADVEIGYGAIFGGGCIVFRDRFDPVDSLETIEKEKITMLGQVPVMYLMQMQTPQFKTTDWSSLELIAWGGANASPILLNALKAIADASGAKLMTGYGSTEMCGFCTYSMADDSMELLATAAGKVVPPFEMKIVDANRKEVPYGTIGEIVMKGPSTLKGYLNNPTATQEVLQDGWYYTSDLGSMNEEGYLFISGRSSEMFKTGGENVFPREIEEKLEQHPAVLFAAVMGIPDDLYQEVGQAFIMLTPGQTTTAEELRTHCKDRLANFKVPKVYDIRPLLPLLPNGKVNKMALKKELGLVKS